jgi:hypothetical protein
LLYSVASPTSVVVIAKYAFHSKRNIKRSKTLALSLRNAINYELERETIIASPVRTIAIRDEEKPIPALRKSDDVGMREKNHSIEKILTEANKSLDFSSLSPPY